MTIYNPYDTPLYYKPAPQAKEAVPSSHQQQQQSLTNFPTEPDLSHTPSIYDDDEMLDNLSKEYPDYGGIPLMDDYPMEEEPKAIEEAQQPLTLEETDPTQRSYFFDDDIDYDEDDGASVEANGFYANPNFRSGILTPDIWDMFSSDWGQKVQ